MKISGLLLGLVLTTSNCFGYVYLSCGPTENFQHEYSIEMKKSFTEKRENFIFSQFGKEIKGSLTAKLQETAQDGIGAVVVSDIITQTSPDASTQYIFSGFASCYVDAEVKPATLAILRKETGDTGYRLVKQLTCRCQTE